MRSFPILLLSPSGRIARANGARAPIYLGAQILKPEAVLAITDPVFSLNRVWDSLIVKGKAFGVIHNGGWCDVGHPKGVAMAEGLLSDV